MDHAIIYAQATEKFLAGMSDSQHRPGSIGIAEYKGEKPYSLDDIIGLVASKYFMYLLFQ